MSATHTALGVPFGDLEVCGRKRALVGSSPGQFRADAAGMLHSGLLAVIATLSSHQRAIGGRRVALAGDLAHRSRLSLGADGMARNAGYAKPALFLAALWTITVGEQGDRADDGRYDRSLLGDDDRTRDQFRSDAAEQLFRHVASCEGHGGNILSIRMVIRMTKESPLIGLGVAEIDGVNETITAGCAFGECTAPPPSYEGSSHHLVV